jgi:CRP-like cAMP-binding protein
VTGVRTTVLDEDRELAAVVAPARLDAARTSSTAAVRVLPAGDWDAIADSGPGHGGFGALVLEGLLVRRVGWDGRFGAELLGTGDLLRPWELDGDAGGTVPFEATWRVMTPARLAVLDLAWTTRMAAFPEVGASLAGRALLRASRLATALAIVQQPRLEERLWMIFWELADRFGRVKADGVHLDVPLTHELLSHLTAARRPSVSGAVTRLAEQGRVRREGRSWVLAGDPPEAGGAAGGAPTVASRG